MAIGYALESFNSSKTKLTSCCLLLQPSILDTMAPHCAKKVFRADNKMKFYNNGCWDWLTKKFRKEVEKFAFSLHIIKVKGLAFEEWFHKYMFLPSQFEKGHPFCLFCKTLLNDINQWRIFKLESNIQHFTESCFI